MEATDYPCKILCTRICLNIDPEQKTIQYRYGECPDLCHRLELNIPIEDGYTFIE